MRKSNKNALLVKEIFIDRVNELNMLIAGLKSGKDFVLIAPRRFGKTTLVNKAFAEIGKDKNFVLISIDIMRYSGSVRSLAEGITEHCLAVLGYKGRLQLLLKQVSISLQLKMSFGDLDIEPIITLLHNKSDNYLLLGHALELFDKVAKKTGKQIIVFFDEFGELYELGEGVIKIFRAVLQNQKNACCVFAGSQETLMNKMFVEKSSAFYRFGDLIKLGSLDKQEVIHYLSDTKIKFSVAQNILDILECHPYYTSKTIKDLLVYEQYGKSSGDFYAYLQRILLTQESPYLEMLVAKVKSKVNSLDILTNLALANLANTGLEDKSRQTISKTVKQLEADGYIYKINNIYKLRDPLLKLYLAQ